MGKYINQDLNKKPLGAILKAVDLIKSGANPIDEPTTFDQYPGKSIVCVVKNGFFDAASWAYCQSKLDCFKREDGRPKDWLIIDTEIVEEIVDK